MTKFLRFLMQCQRKIRGIELRVEIAGGSSACRYAPSEQTRNDDSDLSAFDKPLIFAANHSNRDDVPFMLEAIGKPAVIFGGEGIDNHFDRLILNLNGAVWVNRADKNDRKAAKAKAIAALQNGKNLLIFPEGSWNLTPSIPVLPLHWGIIEMAKAADARIVPVAIEHTARFCRVSFGEPLETRGSCKTAINEVRDAMVSLRWELWGIGSEEFFDKESAKQNWEQLQQQWLDDYPSFDFAVEAAALRS